MKKPSETRISAHFLLSDLINCHSIVQKGYKNVFFDPKNTKFDEISYLCDTLLERFLVDFGPFSVSYGYISPELSRKIVGYQDPDKPSYHRWDAGAAVDICVHDHVLQKSNSAPIVQAIKIDDHYDYSRLITYSESPYICVATRVSESDGLGRRAFYENRYLGAPKVKPKYITYSQNAKTRGTQRNNALAYAKDAGTEWRGAGYPTYHGGGIRQAHHVRVGRYCMLLDFLYNDDCILDGRKNVPTPDLHMQQLFYGAGRVYDYLIRTMNAKRFSIVRGFEHPMSFEESQFSWRNGEFSFVVVPPEDVSQGDVADTAKSHPSVIAVGVDNIKRQVTITGRVSQ